MAGDCYALLGADSTPFLPFVRSEFNPSVYASGTISPGRKSKLRPCTESNPLEEDGLYEVKLTLERGIDLLLF